MSREIPEGGRAFAIRTDKPGVKVSYLHPELFGHPEARPLGLDPATPNEIDPQKVAQSQADLQALVERKRAEALADARRATRQAAPHAVTQSSQK